MHIHMKRSLLWPIVGLLFLLALLAQYTRNPERAPASIGQFFKSCVAMLSGNKRDQDVVDKFLRDSHAKISAVNDDDLTIADFFPGKSGLNIRLSKFNSLGDTLEHSELIAHALRLREGTTVSNIMDFFCGSSIPTLRILAADSLTRSIRVSSIDNDPGAVQVSKENAKALGLGSHYDFHKADAVAFLNSNEIGTETLVALNPPYVPLPSGLNDKRFLPIDGGPDGTKFLLPFLDHPYRKGTLIAMTWSSLSNPQLVINHIYRNFDVLFVQSYETEFGIYTSSPEVLPYLTKQKAHGLAFFKENEGGQRSYTIIGAVLKKK